MTGDLNFTVTATPLPPLNLPRWRRWMLRLLRRPLPRPEQPPGTVPLVFETRTSDGRVSRIYIPAARVERSDGA